MPSTVGPSHRRSVAPSLEPLGDSLDATPIGIGGARFSELLAIRSDRAFRLENGHLV